VSYVTQVFDYIASRYLAHRAAAHLEAGEPPVAVFAFDRIGHMINLEGRYEGAELACAFEFLRKTGLIRGDAVDVGANIGNHALYFAGYFANVVALEPNPRLFELLAINARLSKNIHPLNIGASDVSKEMSLSYDSANWGGGKLSKDRPDASRAFNVPVKVQRLDDLVELAEHPVGLLKIDVEGHELRVLQGAATLIARSRPVVLFEQHPHEAANGSSRVADWLRANGYKSFYEVRSLPSLPRTWRFPGRMLLNGLLRLVFGERKHVVPVERFEAVFYPMVIAAPASQ
jgi:FkbM family methyltransferase